MCGIVAIICKDSRGLFAYDRDVFEEKLIANAVRGMDSTGVFGVSMRNELHIVKQAIDPITFMKSPAYKEWAGKVPNCRAIVGHNRKATQGAVTSSNAHPFKEGNIVLVHNGVLWNAKEINKEVEVDSHALTHEFATKGARATLEEVNGAFALIWYDLKAKELYLWRNAERPLCLVETNNNVYIASELEMMKWIVGRDRRANTIIREGFIKTETLYTIKLDPYKMTEEKLEKKPKTYHVTHPTPVNHEYYGPSCDVSGYEGVSESILAGEERDEVSIEHLRNVQEEHDPSAKVMSSKEIRAKYPFDSKVLFEFRGADIWTTQPKKFEVKGKVYLPGGPIVNGFIYTKSDVTLSTIKEWKNSKKLLGTVDKVMGLRDGTIAIHLDNEQIEIPPTIRLWNGLMIPTLEWELICNNFKCLKCGHKLDNKNPENSSVNETDTGIYKAICSVCLTEAVTPEKQKALFAPKTPMSPTTVTMLEDLHAANDSLKGSTHGS